MKSSFLVISAFALIVACGTRNTRQANNTPGGSLAPQGKFEVNPKAQASDECIPMNDGLDKDLKVGDKVEGSFSVKSPFKTMNFSVVQEMTEVSNSLTRAQQVFKMEDGKEIKLEESCQAAGDAKWSCEVHGGETPKDIIQNFTCEIKNKEPEKIDSSAGTYKIAGQSIAANRRTFTIKGPIECKNGDKVEAMGNGTGVFESFTTTEVVKFPSNNAISKKKSCQETVFGAIRITSDDGKEIFSVRAEMTSAPIRKK